MMLREFHSRNRLRRRQEIDAAATPSKIKSPPTYEDTLTRMEMKRRRLSNSASISSSWASKNISAESVRELPARGEQAW